ncbi:hypothetical protein [uncultured Tateyamaria sp.]|uniref:hypothetical protein n=1 Tax=uncultured Tateyamaria sp. TaxID=455651 RepID=UPI00263406D2|nr:hypothetical protein [uncultured Tateyamaria sp.]
MKTTINTALIAGAMCLLLYQALTKMTEANAMFEGTSNAIAQFGGLSPLNIAIEVPVIAVFIFIVMIVAMGQMIISGADLNDGSGRLILVGLLGVVFITFSFKVVQFLTGSDVSCLMCGPPPDYFSSPDPLSSH